MVTNEAGLLNRWIARSLSKFNRHLAITSWGNPPNQFSSSFFEFSKGLRSFFQDITVEEGVIQIQKEREGSLQGDVRLPSGFLGKWKSRDIMLTVWGKRELPTWRLEEKRGIRFSGANLGRYYLLYRHCLQRNCVITIIKITMHYGNVMWM